MIAPLIYLEVIILIGPIIYWVDIEIIKWRAVLARPAEDPDEIRKKISDKWLFRLGTPSYFLIIANLTLASATLTSVWIFNQTQITQHDDTQLILEQNQSAEEVQFRPYVEILSPIVSRTSPSDTQSDFPYRLDYSVKNNGLTPAYKVNVFISFVNNEGSDPMIPETQNQISQVTSYIGPGELTNDHDPISQKIPLSLYKFGSRNYLKIDIRYYDYADKEHHHTFEGQFIVNKAGEIDPELRTYNDSET